MDSNFSALTPVLPADTAAQATSPVLAEKKPPHSKDGLAVGQTFRLKLPLPQGIEFYVNDDYQYGLWIATYLNEHTKMSGQILSGKMDTARPIEILNLCDNPSDKMGDAILVRTRRTTGSYVGCRLDSFIPLDILFKYFESFVSEPKKTLRGCSKNCRVKVGIDDEEHTVKILFVDQHVDGQNSSPIGDRIYLDFMDMFYGTWYETDEVELLDTLPWDDSPTPTS